MNRKQRRAAESKVLNTAINAMAQEAQGRITLVTVRPVDFKAMMAASAAGHSDHCELMRMVVDMIEGVRRAAPSEPRLCAACPTPLTGGFAVVIAHAARIAPRFSLALGVCTTCGTDLSSIEDAALKGLRSLWPNMVRAPVHDRAGHA